MLKVKTERNSKMNVLKMIGQISLACLIGLLTLSEARTDEEMMRAVAIFVFELLPTAIEMIWR